MTASAFSKGFTQIMSAVLTVAVGMLSVQLFRTTKLLDTNAERLDSNTRQLNECGRWRQSQQQDMTEFRTRLAREQEAATLSRRIFNTLHGYQDGTRGAGLQRILRVEYHQTSENGDLVISDLDTLLNASRLGILPFIDWPHPHATQPDCPRITEEQRAMRMGERYTIHVQLGNETWCPTTP